MHDLQRVLDEGEVVPAVNQIELHPLLHQAALRAFHDEHGIFTEAWSPLARGGELLALTDDQMEQIAKLDRGERFGPDPEMFNACG